MGCGCRKRAKTEIIKKTIPISQAEKEKMLIEMQRKSAAKDRKLKESIKNLKQKNKVSVIEIDRRMKCRQCQFRFLRTEGSQTIEMCGKSNRAIFIIVKDVSFSCPDGKFSATK